jgi:hypothetical protein
MPCDVQWLGFNFLSMQMSAFISYCTHGHVHATSWSCVTMCLRCVMFTLPLTLTFMFMFMLMFMFMFMFMSIFTF